MLVQCHYCGYGFEKPRKDIDNKLKNKQKK